MKKSIAELLKPAQERQQKLDSEVQKRKTSLMMSDGFERKVKLWEKFNRKSEGNSMSNDNTNLEVNNEENNEADKEIDKIEGMERENLQKFLELKKKSTQLYSE